MQRFASLFTTLDRTTKTSAKVAALAEYFRDAPPADATWALAFLTGQRFKRAVPSKRLRGWAAEEASIPAWLVDECYAAVGDLSETLSLLVPDPVEPDVPSLAEFVETTIRPLGVRDEASQRALVEAAWRRLPATERFLFHKLIMGNFRVGVARRLVTRAVAEAAEVETAVMAHRLAGTFEPTVEAYERLFTAETHADDATQPYPFFLASPLERGAPALGDPADWQFEWKWDGLRAQLIRRGDHRLLWSRGDELIAGAFPEIVSAASGLPDGTVLDGEVLAWEGERPLSFHLLQRRIGRKTVDAMLFPDVPVAIVVFDLLEEAGEDLRGAPLTTRRQRLEALLAAVDDEALRLSPVLDVDTWSACARLVENARDHGTEGVIVKRHASVYQVGRPRGDWWKWKTDPYTVDAVLVYAQPGSGRRANLHTDYTFAVWDDDTLVPFTRAYSGLTDEEFREVDRLVRQTTIERKGPVRLVEPTLVFELAFEGIQRSNRHKVGLALRFPRMVRWRRDKTPVEADRLGTLQTLLTEAEGT